MDAGDYRVTEGLIYKRVGDLELALDTYLPPSAEPTAALLHLHGGAVINGTRAMSPLLLDLFARCGIAVISVDYRLAPESRWPAWLDDILDAWSWTLDHAADLNIDSARVGVTGGSAGGYLSCLLAAHAQPGPRLVFSMWGYGEITEPWAQEPDPFYNETQPPLAWEDVRVAVQDHEIPWRSDPLGGQLYLHHRQQGTWGPTLMGCRPDECPEEYRRACPEVLVTPDFPPTFWIHGTADTDVPFECGESMCAAIKGQGVQCEFIPIEGGPHGVFGKRDDWPGTDAPQVQAALILLEDFLREHLA